MKPWRLVLVLVGAALLAAGCTMPSTTVTTGNTAGGTAWDAGYIVSDSVFYNSASMTTSQVQTFLDATGPGCTDPACLRNLIMDTPAMSSPWCSSFPGGHMPFAQMLTAVSQACGINPQVVLVLIQKESQGLTRVPPAALTGFGCPDSGPGGSPNCDASKSGAFTQTYGAVQAFAHARKDDSVVQRYIEGSTPHEILWNVQESGCGTTPVIVRNRATATLYTYTPYTPNQAALDAYPGTGDACSAYGNRNFFRMFQTYFGPTGGGKSLAGPGGDTVLANGVNVTIPDNQFVVAELRGKPLQAPTAGIAKGLAAGFSTLGTMYVWGGGFGPGGAATDGCARGGFALNSCQGQIGWDCSGLTNYVLEQGGYGTIPGDSGSQRAGGQSVSWDQGLPGDIIGFSGHVAMYLGTIGGQRYILEASDVGIPNHVVKLTRTDFDSSLHRYWTPSPA